MKKFIFLLALELYALNLDPCYKKNSTAIYTIGKDKAVAISPHVLIVFNKSFSHHSYKVLNRNSHLDLTLVRSSKKHKHIKLIDTKEGMNKEVAVINKTSYKVGKIVSRQKGFELAKMDIPTPRATILGIRCYRVVGIGMGDGFLETSYIKHFVNMQRDEYADLGVRLDRSASSAVVDLVHPFWKLPFKKGDIITHVNEKPVHSFRDFQALVLFAKPGEIVDVNLTRDGKNLHFKRKLQKMLRLEEESETFLEYFGLFFDEHLRLIRIGKKAKQRHLKIGDKIVMVDKKKISSAKKLMRYLALQNPHAKFLFERNGFQFFMKLDKTKTKHRFILMKE